MFLIAVPNLVTCNYLSFISPEGKVFLKNSFE